MKPGFPLQVFKYYVKTQCKPPVNKEILTLHITTVGHIINIEGIKILHYMYFAKQNF